jgi:hypothetical protein
MTHFRQSTGKVHANETFGSQKLVPNAGKWSIRQHDVQEKVSLPAGQVHKADPVITIIAYTAATIFGVLVYALAIYFLM